MAKQFNKDGTWNCSQCGRKFHERSGDIISIDGQRKAVCHSCAAELDDKPDITKASLIKKYGSKTA